MRPQVFRDDIGLCKMRLKELQRHQILRQLRSIAHNRFDQDTLRLLLIDIRELAQPGSLIRAIGDFLAHPLREEGIVLPGIQEAYAELVRRTTEGAWNGGDREAGLEACAVFNETDFGKEFSQILRSEGFLHDEELTAKLRRQMKGVMLCVICLLAGGRIRIASAEVSEIILVAMSGGPMLGLGVMAKIRYRDRRVDVLWPIVTSSCMLDPGAVRKLRPYGEQSVAIARRSALGKLVMVSLDRDREWAY